MKSVEQWLDACLQPAGDISRAFQSMGVRTFREAARYVQALPYGRNTNRADARSVLREGKGTCSTKHALLAMLAEENKIPVRLMIGIYLMNEANTPGVGNVLTQHGLTAIPEAHCYLRLNEQYLDFTRQTGQKDKIPLSFLAEKEIAPNEIGEEKIRFHQDWLKHWVTTSAVPVKDWRKVWEIREACIAALSQFPG
ncbi:transglutaminase domain-containing protein [Staphylospora marina]|uniref:transglutaminase domain-containing protein n=1 Tax=Staphylospora marina TaxID=2490858 RepID=UPI000F5C126E|nr:transglutaminase domain-containing protein [Staphylospora marina]